MSTNSITKYTFIAGTTKILTWASSGTVPSAIECHLLDANDTVVSTATPVSSGNGYYYAPVTHPNSACWVVNRWVAVINANTYVYKQIGQGRALGVD